VIDHNGVTRTGMWDKREAEHPGIWFLIRPPELGDVVAGLSPYGPSRFLNMPCGHSYSSPIAINRLDFFKKFKIPWIEASVRRGYRFFVLERPPSAASVGI
jgi:hypothetical protein